MRVRDLMEHEVVTLGADDTLGLADDIMRLGRIRHIPVVSADGALVGILSQRDLFRAALSSVLGGDVRAQRDWLGSVRVRDVMTPAPVTVPPEAPVRRAVELMVGRRIGCLPVVDATRLVGLLSETDCLRHLGHLLRLAEERTALPDAAGVS
jgi:CBS domain-containing protein